MVITIITLTIHTHAYKKATLCNDVEFPTVFYQMSRVTFASAQVHNLQKLKNISLKAVNVLCNKNKSNLFE